MEARLVGAAVLAVAIASLGASYPTTNFVVDAPTLEMARKIGDAAERYRHDLAIEWTGKVMPTWSQRCPIKARVAANLGAGGETSFVFERGEVFGWQMMIQGSLERILDSVLPHEVTHTIFACHFRQPLPRWADEGACTSVEHASERAKQQKMLIEFLKRGRGISFSRMFVMKEYPHDILPLYSQGYSLARYLLADGGKRRFLDFVGDGMRDENWPRAVTKYYGYGSMLVLQNAWLNWVKQGSPQIDPDPRAVGDATLVAGTGERQRPEPNVIFRAQSADPPTRDTGRLVPVRRGATAASPAVPGNQAMADLEPVPFPAARAGQSPYPRQAGVPRGPRRLSGPSEHDRAALATPASQQASTVDGQSNPARKASEPGWQMLLEWRRPTAPLTMADRPRGHGTLVKK
jgi:hypothetical protein